MNNKLALATIATMMVSFATAHAEHSSAPAADILITAFRDKQWQVRYELDSPTRQLVFARSQDESRRETWRPDLGFEIVSTSHGEAVQRKDGTPFTTVRIRLDPKYHPLPKDYAPFSPFGDGGMLFHSGRFFACPTACSDDATWSLTLWADPDDTITLDGRRLQYSAHWADSNSGRKVYIGKNEGLQTPEFTAIIDEAVPDAVRTPLLSDLPALLRAFAKRFGSLDEPLTLFASYDKNYRGGWGRQGGTLPNQIFIHFYGDRWETAMQEPDFAFDLAWHFAHEAAHVYQQQRSSTGLSDAWIHEGAAEAFAALELRARNESSEKAVRQKIQRSQAECEEALGDQSIDETLRGTDQSAAYSCGLLLNLHIDAKARARDPEGLFAIWRDYLRRTRNGPPRSRDDYLASIERIGGSDLAASVATLLETMHPKFEAD